MLFPMFNIYCIIKFFYRVPFLPNVPVFGGKMEMFRFFKYILWGP
jgi:hypothetical protein